MHVCSFCRVKRLLVTTSRQIVTRRTGSATSVVIAQHPLAARRTQSLSLSGSVEPCSLTPHMLSIADAFQDETPQRQRHVLAGDPRFSDTEVGGSGDDSVSHFSDIDEGDGVGTPVAGEMAATPAVGDADMPIDAHLGNLGPVVFGDVATGDGASAPAAAAVAAPAAADMAVGNADTVAVDGRPFALAAPRRLPLLPQLMWLLVLPTTPQQLPLPPPTMVWLSIQVLVLPSLPTTRAPLAPRSPVPMWLSTWPLVSPLTGLLSPLVTPPTIR